MFFCKCTCNKNIIILTWCSLVTYKFLLSFSWKKSFLQIGQYISSRICCWLFFEGRYCTLRWTNRTRSWFVIPIDVNSLSGGRNFDVAVPQTQKCDSPNCLHPLLSEACCAASKRPGLWAVTIISHVKKKGLIIECLGWCDSLAPDPAINGLITTL